MTTYADYQRDRIGWFFGLSGGQLLLLALASLPAFWAISRGAWFSALLFAGIWLMVLAVTVVPVRGRSATGWMIASIAYAFGGLLGWTSSRAEPTQRAGRGPRAAPPGRGAQRTGRGREGLAGGSRPPGPRPGRLRPAPGRASPSSGRR